MAFQHHVNSLFSQWKFTLIFAPSITRPDLSLWCEMRQRGYIRTSPGINVQFVTCFSYKQLHHNLFTGTQSAGAVDVSLWSLIPVWFKGRVSGTETSTRKPQQHMYSSTLQSFPRRRVTPCLLPSGSAIFPTCLHQNPKLWCKCWWL